MTNEEMTVLIIYTKHLRKNLLKEMIKMNKTALGRNQIDKLIGDIAIDLQLQMDGILKGQPGLHREQ